MLFIPKWKASTWCLPSVLSHSLRLHKASNFHSKFILYLNLNLKGLFLRLFRDWTRAFRDWAASQPLSPMHLSPLNIFLKNILGCSQLAAVCLPASTFQLIPAFLFKHSKNVWSVTSWGMHPAALHQPVNTSADSLLSYPSRRAMRPTAPLGAQLGRPWWWLTQWSQVCISSDLI